MDALLLRGYLQSVAHLCNMAPMAKLIMHSFFIIHTLDIPNLHNIKIYAQFLHKISHEINALKQ